MDLESIFSNIPESIPTELHHPIIETDSFRVMRVVSKGHTTPIGSWLYEVQNEWVYLVQGHGKILFEEDNREVEMKPGDYIFIPAFSRHRVSWTDPDQVTIWLAVYFSDKEDSVKIDAEF